MKRLESLKNFQLTIEEEKSVNGGSRSLALAAATEICTERCVGQYDCAKDDGSGDYGTTAEFDSCPD